MFLDWSTLLNAGVSVWCSTPLCPHLSGLLRRKCRLSSVYRPHSAFLDSLFCRVLGLRLFFSPLCWGLWDSEVSLQSHPARLRFGHHLSIAQDPSQREAVFQLHFAMRLQSNLSSYSFPCISSWSPLQKGRKEGARPRRPTSEALSAFEFSSPFGNQDIQASWVRSISKSSAFFSAQ